MRSKVNTFSFIQTLTSRLKQKQRSKVNTFPSITATQELVVPKSIPITSFPTGLELDQQNNTKR